MTYINKQLNATAPKTMNKQSTRKEASPSISKASRKSIKNNTSPEEVRPKEKNAPAGKNSKAKATPTRTGKISTSAKKNPDKNSPTPESHNNPKKDITTKYLDKNSIHYYIDKRKEEEKAKGIETCSSDNTDKRYIDRIVYDEELNSFITIYDNGEFEYGYKFEDDEEETEADTVNINENSVTPASHGKEGRKNIKKTYKKKTLNKKDGKGKPRGLVRPRKEINLSLGAALRGTIVLIVLLTVAIQIFLVRPYEQRKKEIWASRKYKSHFNLDPNRPLTEIGELDYENRTVTYTSPMPKDTILPPSPLPKLSREDYLEEPLNLYEDYYEMFYDYYHD